MPIRMWCCLNNFTKTKYFLGSVCTTKLVKEKSLQRPETDMWQTWDEDSDKLVLHGRTNRHCDTLRSWRSQKIKIFICCPDILADRPLSVPQSSLFSLSLLLFSWLSPARPGRNIILHLRVWHAGDGELGEYVRLTSENIIHTIITLSPGMLL